MGQKVWVALGNCGCVLELFIIIQVCGKLTTKTIKYKHENKDNLEEETSCKSITFLLGECITGAGGDGGPRGIFLLILICENHSIIKIYKKTLISE